MVIKKITNTIKKSIIKTINPKTKSGGHSVRSGHSLDSKDSGELKPVLIVTHAGRFHTDDVTSVSIALLAHGVDKSKSAHLLPSFSSIQKAHSGEHVRVVRTFDQGLWKKADVLLDIGLEYDPKRNRFDHHQDMDEASGKRENGIPYSSAGLIWKKFGKQIAGSEEVADVVDKGLIQFIDACDNGVEAFKNLLPTGTQVFSIKDFIQLQSNNITNLDFSSHEKAKIFDKNFMKNIPIMQKTIIWMCQKGHMILQAEKYAKKVYEKTEDKRYIVLDKNILCDFAMFPELLFTVSPNTRGEWSAQVVTTNPFTYEARAKFPMEWAGYMKEDLVNLTGVKDASFCHKDRFLATAHSKEGAVQLIKKALEIGVN